MDKQHLMQVYRRMYLSRRFEETTNQLYKSGEVTGSIHLYIGEEAIAATAVQLMKQGDLFTSTHRGVGHCIICGMDPKAVMAEMMGKATGISRGKGGSMHMFDMSKGNIGTNGIVAGGTSLAVGAALTAKVIKKTDNVVFCFFGEGASNEGVTHESMNMAAVWKLPVIFVCENNLYQVFTTIDESCSVRDISVRAAGYGMPGTTVDGNNVEELEKAFSAAIDRARKGDGPSLVECKTYRWEGHWPGDAYSYGGYRSREEVDEWKAKCPVKRLRKHLVEACEVAEDEIAEIEKQVEKEIEEAVLFARESPEPDVSVLTADLFYETGSDEKWH